MPPVGSPNYQQLNRVLVGKETGERGTKVAPDNKWYGMLMLTRHQGLADSNDYAGDFFGDHVPVRGAATVDGTWQQQLAYEDAGVFQYAIGADTVTDDANTVHGYTHAFHHSPYTDDRSTFAAEYGDPMMIYESQGLFLPEMTISADIDDAEAVWKLNAKVAGITKDLKAGLDAVVATGGSTTTFVKTGWALTISARVGAWVHFTGGTAGNIGLFRQVTANTATQITFAALPNAVQAGDTIDLYPQFTAGVTDRVREKIIGPGTVCYMDNVGGTIGTTPRDGFISFSVTAALNANYKRFMPNVNVMSNRQDLGKIKVTGQIRVEADRKREWVRYVALTPELIRFAQTGSVIDSGASTKKAINLDIYNAVWNDPTEDTRGNNKTWTFPFVGYTDATLGYPIGVAVKNKQSVALS